tara:strand:+ start:12 stop:395 length:384 start_codon:yes stop_codon:yes gene_type:complete
MNKVTKDIVKSLLLLLIIDCVYLYSMSNHYGKLISDIQGAPLKLKFIPTLMVYALIYLGWYHFIYNKNTLLKQKLKDSFVLGLVMYGVYEFTNQAIFNKWTLKTVIIDTMWGSTLLTLVTGIFFSLL